MQDKSKRREHFSDVDKKTLRDLIKEKMCAIDSAKCCSVENVNHKVRALTYLDLLTKKVESL